MVSSTLRVNAGHARSGRLAQQVVAGQPPAYGAVLQQLGIVRLAPGVGHPDHQVGALRIQRMSQVLIKIALQCLVHGHGVLALRGQRLKALPQQISTKALRKGLEGNAQRFWNRPARGFSVVWHICGSLLNVLPKLYLSCVGSTSPNPAICLGTVSATSGGAFQ